MKKISFMSMIIVFLVFTGCTNNSKILTEIKPEKKEDLIEKSTIHDAVRINDIKLVSYFLKNGTDIDKKDKFGYTPLHLAARFNHYKIARLLIENGAKVNTQDKYSDTPLIDSSRNGYSAMSELLICNGANRDIVDKYKLTPYDYAQRANDIRLSNLLKLENLNKVCKKNVEVKKEVEKTEETFKGSSISIDNKSEIKEYSPMICGDIIDPTVVQIQISLDDGKTVYDAKIDEKNKRWCAKVSEKLAAGDYTVAAISINKSNNMTRVEDSFKVAVNDKLFEALKETFKNDFERWNLELVANSYTLRFKNPSSMFLRGSDKISDKYVDILNEFFPKYLSIIKNNKDIISSISIEGHTSSRYRTAKTLEEKFEKNRVLSQKRANAVLAYLKNINDSIVLDNQDLISIYFISKGKSSSELLYTSDGSENIEASRRVEFKINLK